MSKRNSMERPRRRRSSIMDYEQSLMFGAYREDLASFAFTQAEKLNQLRVERERKDETESETDDCKMDPFIRCIRTIYKYGGDLIFFSMLAITMATISFIMDIIVHSFFEFRNFLTHHITEIFVLRFLIWVTFMLIMVLISAIITRILAPHAAGSGVAEMKCVLRGVVLKEYLTMKTFIAKVIGLLFTLGSGLPLGKEGPFVHLTSIMANQFMKLFSNINDPKEYESRFFEVIAVACGVGVAVTFASPVGGVLYSIEIVSVFFSVRSYWHGFFAATVGALFWRLLTVWFEYEENITHVFHTDFRLENPYETTELLTFALLGVLCGFSTYLFVLLNRTVVLFNRRKNRMNALMQRFPLIYPTIITIFFGIMTFPELFGKFYASWLSSEESMHQLFSNYSWNRLENLIDRDEIIDNWRTPFSSIFVNTFLFFVMNLIIVAITATLPIPCGLIVPSFKIGAGLGRFYGECVSYMFPHGMNPLKPRTNYPILAGTYAVAGSAAFAGANTGALSSAVIAFEMTGQVTHLLPVIVSILAATITARCLGPSIYDSLIILKRLPYLPSFISSSSAGHRIFVEEFMERDLLFVWGKCTYRYLRHLLSKKKKLRIYPFVKSPESMILLGTVERAELQLLLDNHLDRQRMVYELRKSMQSLNAQQPKSVNCPVHGQTSLKRFHVNTIPENEEIEMKSLGSVAWEEKQLNIKVDFSTCPIDPAPFQLMEGTSLLKVHNLFSLLGLQLSYVTSLGTLVGVVSLKELRTAIEEMGNRALHKNETNHEDMEPDLHIDIDEDESIDSSGDDSRSNHDKNNVGLIK